MASRRPLLLLLLLLTALGCTRKKTREQLVEARVASLEQAIEAQALSDVREMLTEDFSDGQGRNRAAALDLLRITILQQRGVHIYQEVEAPTFPREGEAEVVLYAAVSGTPLPSFEHLAKLKARLFHVKAKLREVEPGEWRVRALKWRVAGLDELLE
ncbi:hypothetical protein KKF91_13960 [Myxococcota bacterium]|nr:hypothetical protein [Myxococcota bacterium]MBU1431644.1 hypothetical protein [Myxococcota bacterium]MBU1896323.1 hypothetical protein [Myxococcota bacterium]